MELSTKGKGLRCREQKTSFNRKHEYLSSSGTAVCLIIYLFLILDMREGGRGWGLEEPL